jgi:hypothetical protein
MPSITVPATAVPGDDITVNGTGFADWQKKFWLTTFMDGVESGFDAQGDPTNENRPKKDGTFSVGIKVPPVEGQCTIRAYQGVTVVASAVCNVKVPVPAVRASAGDRSVVLVW